MKMAMILSRWISRRNISISPKKQFLSPSFSTATENESPICRPAPPPIRVGLTESAGRAVFATRKIRAGDLLHTAKPIVTHPSLSCINSVCYFCLKKLRVLADYQALKVSFCSKECEDSAKGFYDVETKAEWLDFDNYCRGEGLKYPLVAKRLACMVISGVASLDSIDILQPANLTREMISKVEEGFDILLNAFKKANIPEERIMFLTKQWYTGVLARIRINAFRIEYATNLYEDLLTAAAASVEAEAGVGNAVYMLPSFYNHDCDPNSHIIWIDNANARLKTLRDVEEGEELRICYIDTSMSCDARKDVLLNGFGFNCDCLRCLSGD